MITTQHIQEGLSRAYVQAVASYAGVNVGNSQLDYGIDGTFRKIQKIGGRYFDIGVALDFQLKASIQWQFDGDYVVYDLEAKTYNDLVNRGKKKRAVPLILIVLCLPKNQEEWIEINEEGLLLKKCCYWLIVKGEKTENSSSKRVKIFREQMFTSAALTKLLGSIIKGDFY